jgi:hypothetical protein
MDSTPYVLFQTLELKPAYVYGDAQSTHKPQKSKSIWHLAFGSWLAFGCWHLAVGWHLAFGIWHLAFAFAFAFDILYFAFSIGCCTRAPVDYVTRSVWHRWKSKRFHG